jgi:nicotinamide mononucleotide adenylyltransferase
MWREMEQYPVASAHGRFQPFHNGHLQYLLAAKERCRFLWVGITQSDIRALNSSPHDPHRGGSSNNPFTFFERLEMVTAALVTAGVSQCEFGVIPFPVDTPDLLPDFLPTTVPILTTIYDDWNRYKVQSLRQVGYDVQILWESNRKPAEGVQVRRLTVAGNEGWRDLVPTTTAVLLDRLNARQRLQTLDSSL